MGSLQPRRAGFFLQQRHQLIQFKLPVGNSQREKFLTELRPGIVS